MKSFLTAVLFALSCVFAANVPAQIPPYGLYVMQGDVSGAFFYGRYFTPANPASSYILMYDGATSQPKLAVLGTGLSWDGTTLAATGGAAAPARSFSYAARALNSCFQVSSTRDSLVHYGVDVSTSLSLSGGAVGTVYLRAYSNSACTASVQEVSRFVNGQTGTLTVGLALTQNVTGTLSGTIPAGMWVQLVTENTTGTPAFTARQAQETLL